MFCSLNGMRRRLFVPLAFVSLSILTVVAGQMPLTVKDISLMLRSGYSNNAILKELAVRHFADTLDEPKQNTLLQAHASDELVTALQSGKYSLSPAGVAAAQEKIADQAKRQRAEAERLQFNTLDRDRRVQESQAGVINAPGVGHNVVYDFVKGDLVSSQNGTVGHFDDSKFENKKLIGLYFSAHWCGPCRKFTPELVDYYNRNAPQHPEFDIIFVSSDRSQSDMEKYMHEANMPWPAIDFSKIAGKQTITKYAGRGIPCLVLIDSTGKVVSSSFNGTDYVGPKKVLADLDGIFARGSVAQAR
jgi:nucleoredoxin